MTTKIWNNLAIVKFKSIYIGHLISKYQRYDLLINVFLAIATSGSIAAWAIWKEFPIIWASVIALSHVVNVIRPFFPYSRYTKILNDKYLLSQNLFLDYERVWYQIEKAKLTEDAIAEKYFELSKKQNEVFNLDSGILISRDQKLSDKVEKEYLTFLKNNYNIHSS